MQLWALTRARTRRSKKIGKFQMKQMNVFPLLLLLIAVLFLVYWLRP